MSRAIPFTFPRSPLADRRGRASLGSHVFWFPSLLTFMSGRTWDSAAADLRPFSLCQTPRVSQALMQ